MARKYLLTCCLTLMFYLNSAIAGILSVDAMPIKWQNSYQYKQQYAGRIRSEHITDLGFELIGGRTGTLTAILVDVGDNFKKGQVLAKLDTRIQKQRLLQLKAQLNEAKANLVVAQSNTKRMVELKKNNYASAQGYDNAMVKEKVFIWKIAALNAQIVQATIVLSKLTINAPFDGMVADRYLSLGALVQSGQKVLQVIDRGQHQVNIGVPVRYLDFLKVDHPVDINVDNMTLKGKVKSISAHRNPVTQSHNVLITTTNADSDFIPNQALATIELMVTVKRKGTWVPITALQQNFRGLWSLYGLKAVTSSTYRVVKHHAKIYFSDDFKVYISSDVKQGSYIIKDGLLRIVPGEIVEISKQGNNGEK